MGGGQTARDCLKWIDHYALTGFRCMKRSKRFPCYFFQFVLIVYPQEISDLLPNMCNRASSPPLPLSVLLGRDSASRTGGQAARRRFWTMFQTLSQFATGVCKRHSMRRCRGGSLAPACLDCQPVCMQLGARQGTARTRSMTLRQENSLRRLIHAIRICPAMGSPSLGTGVVSNWPGPFVKERVGPA